LADAIVNEAPTGLELDLWIDKPMARYRGRGATDAIVSSVALFAETSGGQPVRSPAVAYASAAIENAESGLAERPQGRCRLF
jgi:hypothetical protein